jgi:hypothetical protein
MELDLIGRIENTNLSTSKPLLPLFEAIINSIQAIEARRIRDGIISIQIERTEDLFNDEGENVHPLKSFTISDNGIGFNDANFKSFNKADTTLKKSIGGKGIGRFIWLKAFDKVIVESIYKNGQDYKKRNFIFKLSEKGIEEDTLVDNPEPKYLTTVKLSGLKETYTQFCPRKLDVIAEKIIEHCLVYFVMGNLPIIQLVDEANKKSVVLNDIFRDIAKSTLEEVEFTLKIHRFKLSILKLFKAHTKHELHFFAHNRQVKQFSIDNDIPDLSTKLFDSDIKQEFSVNAFLTSNYLDQIVNQERTILNFLPDTEDDRLFQTEISEQELKDKVMQILREKLAAYLNPIRESKAKRIVEFVNVTAPQYKPLLKYKPELIEQIKPDLKDDKLDMELYKAQQGLELEIRNESKVVFSEMDNVQDLNEYKTKFDGYFVKLIEVGNSKLSQYILHRKTVLELLKKQINIKADDTYFLEDSVHKIIFPLRTTSEEVPLTNQNLWLIDEKLNYHQYLASDKRLDKLENVEVNSPKRPDVIVFNNPFALVSDNKPYQSIVILEFKKPMRNNYSDEENPIDQVLGYVENIIAGKALDRNGRPFNIPINTPFYAYIICDITPAIEKYANRNSFIKSTDGLGFFGYVKEPLNTYIEIIGYDKMIIDSEKRNKILFEHLNIS